ncbi:hypothetical protein [Kitasatospora sp. MAP5-34]|uniref:hypothetical protein n=1 Tax=Kitasatospora sp. MAP5-34 TaxID=3035102 RepID=UPI002476B41C|nr:hypothetical protein [Kitasatospora sp. MAP5-34]MDH6580256.1 hypothetical protein [Kitasatospora sp. MAP5-34]
MWDALATDVREQVDGLLIKGHRIHAIKVIRDASPEPVPGIHECLDQITDRYAVLGRRFDREPTAPLNVDALTAKIRELPRRPEAIEAVWDGDTQGWFVELLGVTTGPRAAYHLALIRFGTDMRLFNSSLPSWPEAEEANTVGRALAERLGLPFHFASPSTPDDSTPRWWDRQ